MCAILLHIGDEEITLDHPALSTVVHRGPDSGGARSFDLGRFKVGLGHRRLSIIDLSERGAQPMRLLDSQLWTVFNGEIYNHIEIRKELEAAGASFKSDCDTEVLLAAYAKWGKSCLDKFNGMFSFCILDAGRRRIFAARDRLGIKPLLYWNSPAGFAIASEIKQLAQFKGFKAEADKGRLYHFLNTGDFSYDSGTLWKGVCDLEPGHLLEIDLDTWRPGDPLKPVKWYSPPFFEEPLKISFEDASAEFRRLLADSVRLRLRSDVPVGFLLSGGLDSSTLVGLGHAVPREKGAHLKTYSSCYDDPKIDEREFIQEMLKATGADSCLHHPKPGDVAQWLEKVIWHNDLPILHGSVVPHWLLYKQIKDENDSRIVIVEGQGGDEILCGYGDFHWAFLNQSLRTANLLGFLTQYRSFQSIHKEPLKIVARKFRRMRFPSGVKYPANPILDTDFLLGGGPVPGIPVRREAPSVADLHKNRFTILRYILHNVDRNSMAHSREARVPFLDYRLVEFCLRLPPEFKISAGYSKRLLRDAAKDVLPDKIRLRTDKQGYSSPMTTWLQGPLSGLFKSEVERCRELPFIRKDAFDKAAKDSLSQGVKFDPALWRAAVAGLWIKTFKVSI